MTTSTSTAKTIKHLHYGCTTGDMFQGHQVHVYTSIDLTCPDADEQRAALEFCQMNGHDLGVLDYYDVPTGELICYRCWGGCPDPTFDEREAAFLAWKHWGWRATGLSRRRRLGYWANDVLSRVAVAVFGRR